MKVKRIISFILTAIFTLILCAAASAEPVKADAQLAEQQITYFSSNLSAFQQNGTEGKWYYAVTDLDHNGMLELIAVATDEAGNSKALRAWTFSSESQEAVSCSVVFPEGMANPGITTETAKAVYDAATDRWTYFFSTDLVLGEQDVYSFRCTLALQNIDLAYEVLPTEHRQILNGIPAVSYLDQSGTVIGSDSTGGFSTDEMKGASGEDVHFYWIDSSSVINFTVLSDSYLVFIGDKKGSEIPAAAGGTASVYNTSPAYTPAPIYTQAPVYTPVYTPEPTLSNDATHDPMYDDLFASGQAPVWTTPVPANPAQPSQPTPYLNRDPLYGQVNGPSSYYVPTPAPTQHIDLYVTRNPTDENRKVGSTANFVANANIRDSLHWTFVSPGGSSYSAQEFAGMFPNSPLSGLYEGVLSVSNVTEDMNGWGAYCTFFYEDQVANSGTGYIWIY